MKAANHFLVLEILTQAYVAGIILAIVKTVWIVIEAKLLSAEIISAGALEIKGITTLSLSLNAVTVATLALQVLFSLVILVGLFKKKITYVMIILGPIGICYVIEALVFIGGLLYVMTQFESSAVQYNVGQLIAYSANLLVTPVFLLMIRRYYLKARDNSEDQKMPVQEEKKC